MDTEHTGFLRRLEHVLFVFAVFHMIGLVLIFFGQVIWSILSHTNKIKKASWKNTIWTGVGVTAIASGPYIIDAAKMRLVTYDCAVTGKELSFKTKPTSPEVYVINGTGQPLPLTQLSATEYRVDHDIDGDDVRIVDDGHTLITKPADKVWQIQLLIWGLALTGLCAFIGGVKGKEYE